MESYAKLIQKLIRISTDKNQASDIRRIATDHYMRMMAVRQKGVEYVYPLWWYCSKYGSLPAAREARDAAVASAKWDFDEALRQAREPADAFLLAWRGFIAAASSAPADLAEEG